MHIPNSMLNGAICPVTAAVSVLIVGGVALAAAKVKEKPSGMRFGAVTAFIFSAQMLNYPIQHGTSGHLLGGVLAAALLGVPFGVLATALVLVIQTIIFSDGGMAVLGANILNMSVIGAGIGGLLFRSLSGKSDRNSMQHLSAIGLAGCSSVILAAFACSMELAIAGTITFSRVVGAMMGIHALIGIGEGLITVLVYNLFLSRSFSSASKWAVNLPVLSLAIMGAMLSPFVCGFQDGLEWISRKYQFFQESAPTFVSPLANYTISFIAHPIMSTALAGVMGMFIALLGGLAFAKMLNCKMWAISKKEF